MEESDQAPEQLSSSSSVLCKDDEAETVNTGCGWGRFRPAILAPFAHVWTFIVLYVVFSFTHAVQGSYPFGILTTLERQFNLSSSLAGFIVSTSLIGYMVGIVVVSLFFAKRNTPRLFAFSMLLTSISAFLYFLPHIVCGNGNEAINGGQSPLNATSLIKSGSGAVQLCSGDSGIGGPSEAERTCSSEERQKADEGVSYVLSAVLILSIADLVHGIAGAPSWTVGLAFIDDHTPPELSAKLIGLMFTVRLISPIVSFAMGGYFLSIHTTLKETDLTQEHPQWIGAWWLGFIINTIANFILFIPMSMLPKNLRPIGRSSAVASSSNKGKEIAWEEEQKEDGNEKMNGVVKRSEGKEEVAGKEEDGNEKMNGVVKRSEGKEEVAGKEHEEEQNNEYVEEQEEEGKTKQHKEEKNEKKQIEAKRKNLDEGEDKKEEGMRVEKIVDIATGEETSIGAIESIDASSIDFKEFPKAMIRLISNPIYVLTVLSICCDWASTCFTSFSPKYFEVHFQKTASFASLVGGMIPAICAAGASYVGGIVAGKITGFDKGVAGLCRMNFLVSLTTLLLLVPAGLISCPNISFSGHLVNDRLNLTTDCNVNCGCTSDVFDPVCGSDGLFYFSPCHAGCTQLGNSTAHLNSLPGRLVRSDECQCVAPAEEIDEDEDERGRVVYDGFCDSGCTSLIPYILTLIAILVIRNLDNASCTTIICRCIRQEDKSYALGLWALCIVLSILPALLLYGKVFDSSCILWRTSSCTDSKGSCLLYDRHSLRLNYHRLAMGLNSIATILYCVTYFLARRKLSLLTDQQKTHPAAIKTINTKLQMGKPKETRTY